MWAVVAGFSNSQWHFWVGVVAALWRPITELINLNKCSVRLLCHVSSTALRARRRDELASWEAVSWARGRNLWDNAAESSSISKIKASFSFQFEVNWCCPLEGDRRSVLYLFDEHTEHSFKCHFAKVKGLHIADSLWVVAKLLSDLLQAHGSQIRSAE